jgi:hypothetical protein
MNLIKQGKWSMIFSGLCAVHCLLTPVFIVALSVTSGKLMISQYAEYLLFSAGLFFAIITMFNSFKIHRQLHILFITFSGFALIVAAHCFDSLLTETVLSFVGSILAIYGLYKNQLHIKSCRH